MKALEKRIYADKFTLIFHRTIGRNAKGWAIRDLSDTVIVLIFLLCFGLNVQP